jgi:tetratricopeptide (TPR) repeat protein
MRLLVTACLCLAAAPASAQPSVEVAIRELTAAQSPPVDEEVLERAAQRMVTAVDADPEHRAAIVGLYNAAHAFASLDRWQSAELLWQRVVDEGTPRLQQNEDLLPVVANAYEQLARRAALRQDWVAAVAAYRRLADSPVFARSGDRSVADSIHRALEGAAHGLEQLGEPVRAARYYLRLVDRQPTDPGAPDRLDHAAELFAAAGEWAEAKAASERFLVLFGRRAMFAELRERARERIARAEAALGRR